VDPGGLITDALGKEIRPSGDSIRNKSDRSIKTARHSVRAFSALVGKTRWASGEKFLQERFLSIELFYPCFPIIPSSYKGLFNNNHPAPIIFD
jgi:hypothetical protein